MNTISKRIIALVMCVCMLSSLSLISSAKLELTSEGYQEAVMNIASPTIDGVISEEDGWSDPVRLDRDHGTTAWAQKPMLMGADIYFAYSKEGIYFAANVVEEETLFWPVTGEDYDKSSSQGVIMESTSIEYPNIADNSHEYVDYGFDGDTVCFTIDPLGELETTLNQNLTRYNVSIINGKAEMYRTVFNKGYITEQVEVAAVMDKELGTFVCEAFIPWTIICEDIDTETFGEITLTPEEMYEDGAQHRAMVTYMDRFWDEEAEAIDTWTRCMTICDTTYEGTPAVIESAFLTRDYGLLLTMGGCKHANATESSIIQFATHTKPGYVNMYCPDCESYVGVVKKPRLDNPNPFSDVKDGKWYTKAVCDCYAAGFVNGTSATTFSPSTNLSRAMIINILANMSGEDISQYASVQSFTDVPQGKWYHNAVEWAKAKGVSSGTTPTTFSPNGELSRQELAVLLYNFTISKGYAIDSISEDILDAYTDASTVSSWARAGVMWAVDAGLISGTGDGTTLSPKMVATRAQAALIIINFDDAYFSSPFWRTFE